MDDGREDKPAHTGPFGRIDHAFTNLSLVGQKCWRNIENGINVLQGRVKTCSVTQVAYRDLCRATYAHGFALSCVPNQPANLYTSLC
jgi:hypothetical protein